MTTRPWLRIVPVAALTVLLTAASASAAPRRVFVRVHPPAPIVEVHAIAPHRGYVWIAGYQRWNGRAYNWQPGHWAKPPRARAAWVPARWVQDRRQGWYFVEGHWR